MVEKVEKQSGENINEKYGGGGGSAGILRTGGMEGTIPRQYLTRRALSRRRFPITKELF